MRQILRALRSYFSIGSLGQCEAVLKDELRIRPQAFASRYRKDEWLSDAVPCERVSDGFLAVIIDSAREGTDFWNQDRGYNLGAVDVQRVALMLALDLRDERARRCAGS